MLKQNFTLYTNVLIQADLDFIKYQVRKRKINLIAGTGLQKLIDDCQYFIDLPSESPVTNSQVKPVLVAYSLADTLRVLWKNRKDFRTQLAAMNTGSYEYGKVQEGENNFKDFEFELFSASALIENNLNAELPQHTEGKDLLYGNIDIQCKHPEVFTRKKIDRFLRDFQQSLRSQKRYGVLGIGVDDYMGFTDESFPTAYDQFQRAYVKSLNEQEVIMKEIFDDTLRFCPNVLGVMSSTLTLFLIMKWVFH